MAYSILKSTLWWIDGQVTTPTLTETEQVEQQMEHNKDSLCTYVVEYLQPAPPHSSRSAQGKGKMSLSIQHDV